MLPAGMPRGVKTSRKSVIVEFSDAAGEQKAEFDTLIVAVGRVPNSADLGAEAVGLKIDARGFVFGSAVAYELGVGFVPIRKRGKLPYQTEVAKYSLEYGEAEMEMHIDAIRAGERVVLVDDLLATGGTSAAAAVLIRKAGGNLVEAQFLIELEFLHGRKQLEPTPVTSFLKY